MDDTSDYFRETSHESLATSDNDLYEGLADERACDKMEEMTDSNCRNNGNMPNNRDTRIVSKFFSKANTHRDKEFDTIESGNACDRLNELEDCDDVRDFRFSQVNIDDDGIQVPNFFNITPRSIPASPHRVIEEEFKSNPWAMLIATIFLTKTTAKVARPYMRQFFADFPTPYDVLNVSPMEIEPYFDNLGMRKRAHMIWRMSYEFVSAKWRRASDLCGIGKYGEDAYRLFCLGHTNVEPNDRYLRLYLDWLKSQNDYLEAVSEIDCSDQLIDPTIEYYLISLK